jgi:hypothetical protein
VNDKTGNDPADMPPEKKRPRKSISMHADVEVWDDCCSCEAEPYWMELMDEEQGSD